MATTERTRTGHKMSRNLFKTEERRREIFESVAKVMASRTSGSFTLEEIASSLNGSRGIIYYYFKSKADILFQLNMYMLDLLEEAARPINKDGSLSAEERLKLQVRAAVICGCEHWELSKGLWNQMPPRLLPASMARVIIQRRKRMEDGFAALLAEVLEVKGMNSKLNAITISRFILGLIASMARWYSDSGPYTAEELADYVVDSVFRGNLLGHIYDI
jgi:AcrR family transcriptional regulator